MSPGIRSDDFDLEKGSEKKGKKKEYHSLFLGSAVAWDLVTMQDPTQAKNWGLTALMIAVLAKDAANRVAAYQKPLKD